MVPADHRTLLLSAWLVVAGLAQPASCESGPRVAASIAPVHALVAGVMHGIGVPALIVRGYGSPHNYQMRPSDSAALHNAEVIFWVGEPLETFLAFALRSAGSQARVVELSKVDSLTLLPTRRGTGWQRRSPAPGADIPPGDGHGTEHETPPPSGSFDPHLWLDVGNAKRFVEVIAGELSQHDPVRAPIYHRNRASLLTRLDDLDGELRRRLAPVREVPFIVFHDAFQYLERRYGLSAVGSLLVDPQRMPSAKRVSELRRQIASLGVRCVFREPLFESALVATLIEGTGVQVGILDPLGSGIRSGPDAYFAMMRSNADALVQCLSAGAH